LNFASETNRPVFFFGFAAFLLCAWVADNFKRSRTGRGFFSLRENEKAAATFGIELTRYRLIAFMLSGAMAALAGAVFALRAGTGAVTALDFPTGTSLLLIAMVIIGGLGSIVGSALGAFLLVGVTPLLEGALGNAAWVPYLVGLVFGTALIVTLTRARGGLAGLFFLPRDPVVQGLVWHDEETSAPTDGARPDGRAESARELAVTAPGRTRRPARSARR
jgi:branched-chain amino acid transport system permease protein